MIDLGAKGGLLAAAYGLCVVVSGCSLPNSGTATMKYEMAVEATIAGHTYRGSSVQELQVSRYPTLLGSENSVTVKYRGRAVLIPMGNRLIAVLMETAPGGQYGNMILESCALYGDNIVDKVNDFNGSCAIDGEIRPLVIETRGYGEKVADIIPADPTAIRISITSTQDSIDTNIDDIVANYIGSNTDYPMLALENGSTEILLGGPEFAKREF